MIKAHTLLLLVLAASVGFVSSQDILNSPYDADFEDIPLLYDAT